MNSVILARHLLRLPTSAIPLFVILLVQPSFALATTPRPAGHFLRSRGHGGDQGHTDYKGVRLV